MKKDFEKKEDLADDVCGFCGEEIEGKSHFFEDIFYCEICWNKKHNQND